ncbi:MAG: lytic murein transglycosylase [Gammaproteobacteria bacterium]|nr:MAG: lytic murein transglycosylase [Gammaproteobacteria bacterium]
MTAVRGTQASAWHRTVLIRGLAALLLLAGAASGLRAEEGDFDQCVTDLQERARSEGISQTTVDEVLGRVQFVPRVIELDRRQPEFTQTFTDYFGRRVTEDRVQRGRALLAEHQELLHRVQRTTGVPSHYLVAFWGLETNFGSFFGNMSVPDSLATLACDPRRSDYFTGELMAALRIIDAGDITPERMQGSWAGAMGHVQFMPSVFLRYAVDGDGSGRRDLWGSIPDAMASAGNFLRGIGWEPGQRWGREVRLPEGFAYDLAGRHQRYSLSDWRARGVTTADGASLPDVDLEASLLVPSGHRGPAFLVYDNFEVIMRWNRSEFFALAVGHLADRIAGAAPLRQPPPADAQAMALADVRLIQEQLNEKGFDAGAADGIFGPATRSALSRFQQSVGLVADGHPHPDVLEKLLDGSQ